MRRAASCTLLMLLAACEAEPTRPVSSDGVRQAGTLAPPPGAVARGAEAERRALRTAPPADAALLAAGARGYADFCAPCHGAAGAGDGRVIAHGFTIPRALTAIDRSEPRVARIIAEGYGAMLPMADQVAPAERWAIAAHIARLPER